MSKVLEMAPSLRSLTVISDFEVASMNAVQTVLPQTRIVGCSFICLKTCGEKYKRIIW
jgi:hypothetical protein